MKSTFEVATRYAIEEILKSAGKETRFGVLMTNGAIEQAVDELYGLFHTSRNLKSRGDQLISSGVFGGVDSGRQPRRGL